MRKRLLGIVLVAVAVFFLQGFEVIEGGGYSEGGYSEEGDHSAFLAYVSCEGGCPKGSVCAPHPANSSIPGMWCIPKSLVKEEAVDKKDGGTPADNIIELMDCAKLRNLVLNDPVLSKRVLELVMPRTKENGK